MIVLHLTPVKPGESRAFFKSVFKMANSRQNSLLASAVRFVQTRLPAGVVHAFMHPIADQDAQVLSLIHAPLFLAAIRRLSVPCSLPPPLSPFHTGQWYQLQLCK